MDCLEHGLLLSVMILLVKAMNSWMEPRWKYPNCCRSYAALSILELSTPLYSTHMLYNFTIVLKVRATGKYHRNLVKRGLHIWITGTYHHNLIKTGLHIWVIHKVPAEFSTAWSHQPETVINAITVNNFKNRLETCCKNI